MVTCPSRLPLVILALVLAGVPGRAQTQSKNPGTVSSLDRFSGRISPGGKALTKTGAAPPNIHYQVLSLAPGTRAAVSPRPDAKMLALPLKSKSGFVVYELRAGKLTTIVNGNRQERREGEFWIVRPGETMSLETHDDSVVLQTIQLPDQ
jgi:hypothetical protein